MPSGSIARVQRPTLVVKTADGNEFSGTDYSGGKATHLVAGRIIREFAD